MGRPNLLRHAIRLEAFTVGWNVLEALVAIGAGWRAGSIALVGFGLDSVIESISGVVLYGRLRHEARALADGGGLSEEEQERRERRALRIVGITFFLLAAYVSYESVGKLVRRELPGPSPIGTGLLVLSLAVMPFLAHAKFSVARALESAALRADAKETLVCSLLSAITLAGLLLNRMLGWWWADPAAALALVPWLLREGWEMVRGEEPPT